MRVNKDRANRARFRSSENWQKNLGQKNSENKIPLPQILLPNSVLQNPSARPRLLRSSFQVVEELLEIILRAVGESGGWAGGAGAEKFLGDVRRQIERRAVVLGQKIDALVGA